MNPIAEHEARVERARIPGRSGHLSREALIASYAQVAATGNALAREMARTRLRSMGVEPDGRDSTRDETQDNRETSRWSGSGSEMPGMED